MAEENEQVEAIIAPPVEGIAVAKPDMGQMLTAMTSVLSRTVPREALADNPLLQQQLALLTGVTTNDVDDVVRSHEQSIVDRFRAQVYDPANEFNLVLPPQRFGTEDFSREELAHCRDYMKDFRGSDRYPSIEMLLQFLVSYHHQLGEKISQSAWRHRLRAVSYTPLTLPTKA